MPLNLQQKIKGFIDKNDKLIHWLVCSVIGLGVLFLTKNIYCAISSIVIAGFAKECFDKWIKKTFFDWWDIVVDLAAIPVVLLVYLLLF